MKNLRFFFTFSLLYSLGQAQPVEVLVQEAMRNNPQVKAFQHQRNAIDARADALGAYPAPTLGVEFSQIPTSSTNIVNDAISNNVSFSQMFMLGGKLSAMSDAERKRGKVVDQSKASFGVQLRARIKMNYYQIWLIDRQLEVQRNTLSILEALVRSLQSSVLTNRLREADLLSIQAEVASTRAILAEKLARRSGLVGVVNSLLGRNDLSQPVVVDTLLESFHFRAGEDRLADQVRNSNPGLLAMHRMKEMNEAMITSARRDLIPDLMVQGMIMRMPNGMLLTGGPRSADAIQQSMVGMAMQNTDWMYSIMFSITLPFVPWSVERSTAKAAELRYSNLSIDAERESMQREMIASVRSSVIKYTANDSLAQQYTKEILPLARQSAQAQTIAYQNGQVPISTVLDARRMELMKQDDYYMVLMERQMALVDIEMMIGVPPALTNDKSQGD